MTTELPDQPADFKDRKGGLIFFGILEILMGLFCLLIIAVSVLGILLAPYAGPGADQMVNVRVMLPTVVLYGVGAVIFFWLGIGSITAKRWARSLMLILSAVWLAVGVPAFGFLAYLMPKMMTMMQDQGQQLPEAALIIMQCVIMSIYFLLFVALPVAFFLFYRSPHVKATVEKRDPAPRWTDARPLPVLALSLVLYFGSGSLLLMLVFPALPLFGTVLTGLPLAIYSLSFSALLFFIAKAVYDLKMTGWIGALVVPVLGYGAGIATFLMTDYRSLYIAMGYTEQQIELLHLADMWEHTGMVTALVAMMVLMLAIWTGYLFYVKRFFVTDPSSRGGRP